MNVPSIGDRIIATYYMSELRLKGNEVLALAKLAWATTMRCRQSVHLPGQELRVALRAK